MSRRHTPPSARLRAMAGALLLAGMLAGPVMAPVAPAPAADLVAAAPSPSVRPASASTPDPSRSDTRDGSRTAARWRELVPAEQRELVPEPPPLRATPPAARVPGPATGVRAPSECAPYPTDPTGTTDAVEAARRLQLGAVHQLATGAGQVIAVIDTGVAPHQRLAGRLRGGGDFITGGDGRADCDGHGTAVAGLLAASPGPDDDVVGMAPDATLLAIRQSSEVYQVAGSDGRQRAAGDVRTLAEAVVLAVERGAKVINISEAACLSPERAAREGAVLQAALRFASRRGVVVVAAAGNIGPGCDGGAPYGEVALPGWYDDDVITVGAVGPDDSPATFTVPGPWVDVAAPGTGLRTLAVAGGLTGTVADGTSFAAPWVAGLAALIRERFPDLSAAQVRDRILATARPAPGGHDLRLGYGVVDPIAALTADPAVLTPDASVHRTVLAPAPAPASGGAPMPALLGGAVLAAAAIAGAVAVRRRA